MSECRHPWRPDRRTLLRWAGAAGLAVAQPGGALAFGAARSRGRLGLQAITVMDRFGRSPASTLQAMAAIGYRDIETIGALGLPAPALRRMFRAAGLSSTAQHICPADFYPQMLAWSRGQVSTADTLAKLSAIYALNRIDVLLDESIRVAHALGQHYLVWSYLPEADLTTVPGILRVAAILNRAGQRCRAEGLTLAFHNGSKGFSAIDGVRPYDLLLRETDPQLLKMELDVYWMTKVGGDPIAYLSGNPGRYPMLHLKDIDAAGNIVGLGRGVLDFRSIVQTARSMGTKTFFFEYDQAPDPLANASRAFEIFRRIT
jgi:sugar phosphate isomerase/epimerase